MLHTQDTDSQTGTFQTFYYYNVTSLLLLLLQREHCFLVLRLVWRFVSRARFLHPLPRFLLTGGRAEVEPGATLGALAKQFLHDSLPATHAAAVLIKLEIESRELCLQLRLHLIQLLARCLCVYN